MSIVVRIFLIIVTFSFLPFYHLCGDNFRGNIACPLEIELNNPSAKACDMAIDDLLAITLKGHFQYANALDIVIQIPPSLSVYRDSFALQLYRDIYPAPQQGRKSYSGRALYHHIISENLIHLRVPLTTKQQNQAVSGITTVKDVLEEKNFPLIVTVEPIMKGIPEKVYKSLIHISVAPLLNDLGELTLKISPLADKENPYTVYLDDKLITYPFADMFLKTGAHSLKIVSKGFFEEVLTFDIAMTKTTPITIELKALKPRIKLEAPENTLVFLDGNKFSKAFGEVFDLEPGEHTVLFKLGDYQLSKKFNAEMGKSYNISLFLDILIQDY